MEINKKYIINLQGKDFVTFEGLLVLFHENEGNSIITEELEKSSFEIPMFKATVSGKKGTFTGHGDAHNTNVNSMIAKHKYRMAETRAIARALRWYNNIGLCSVDEMGGDTKGYAPDHTPTPSMINEAKPTARAATINNGQIITPTTTNKCQKCGADMVLNPKTNKIFCKEKCWLN